MLLDFFVTFKWIHLIDILVISFIIHRIFMLLRGSPAFQVALGLIFILILQAIAHMAGLVLTSWFFRALGAIAVLASVVLFRREIRELLIQTSPIRLFLGRPTKTSFHTLEPLISAIYRLANARTGALIVLQNHDPLSERLYDGYELNGKLIPQVIESLFAKQSPLHDGAVVISGNRIRWIGTFLPLTTRENLPAHFGTRHRAAIGLSEHTDATVVVISEERGEVNLVEKGSITVMHNQQQLRNHLMQLAADRPIVPKSGLHMRGWLTQTAGVAMIFLLVSMFWGIYLGRQSLIKVNAPIDFRNIPHNLTMKQSSAENVELQISGNRIMINDLGTDDVRVFVDLEGFPDGVHSIDLEDKNVRLPAGLAVAQMSPAQITLEMEKVIQKKLVVRPQLSGRLAADGRKIMQIEVIPETVTVSGPSSELGSQNIVYTNPIRLDTLEINKKMVVSKVALALPHESVDIVGLKGKTVQVIFRFVPEP